MKRVDAIREALALAEAEGDLEQQLVLGLALGEALQKEGDFDGAIAVAQNNNAEASSVANLALALQDAGRIDDAKAVLEPACERLQGGEATRCYDFLATLNRG